MLPVKFVYYFHFFMGLNQELYFAGILKNVYMRIVLFEVPFLLLDCLNNIISIPSLPGNRF
jgi:hypothetical protein